MYRIYSVSNRYSSKFKSDSEFSLSDNSSCDSLSLEGTLGKDSSSNNGVYMWSVSVKASYC